MGEADLLEPWNDNDSVERIDASAFQDLANPELYTRRLKSDSKPAIKQT